MLFLLTGCSKNSSETILKKTIEKIENLESYNLKGELQMINNETIYKYDVSVVYMEEDFFKVSLKNKTNNHEQIILKNEEGVFVITPSLNKSFKFQSDWPYNNSQAYLLQSIIKDLKDDKETTGIITKNGDIIFESKVNYINNETLKKQKVYMDKKNNITKIEILDSNNKKNIIMEFQDINYNQKYKKDYFSVDENTNVFKNTDNSNLLDDIVYPMYIPKNTKLLDHEEIISEDSKRVILDFDGESSFTLVQEKIYNNDKFETNISNGNPIMIGNVFGNLENDSLNWYDQGIEYFLVSDTLNNDELIKVALSINNTNLIK